MRWQQEENDMIDIHTHILPGVDDGAEDLTDALLMAELAAESGVHTIIATPHGNIPGGVNLEKSAELKNRLRDLQEKIWERGVPLQLLSGMEIYVTEDVAEKMKDGKVLSLNESDYYLIEFGFFADAGWITDRLEEIRAMGGVPVIAHPERYVCIQKKPEIAADWIDLGCQLQMNKGSIFGKFGRASFYAADRLLGNDCITYVASDAHSPYHRTTYMKDIQEFLQEEYSSAFANRLLQENPQRFLLGGSQKE